MVQCASVAIAVGGTTPASRSLVCQTPPRARKRVLSIAAARPQVAHGGITAPSARPRHPTCAGKVVGMACQRRSHVRRGGKRPSTVSSAHRVRISGVGWANTRHRACTVCKCRTSIMTKACRNSRSGYVAGRPRWRLVGGGGLGPRPTSVTRVTSSVSCSIMVVASVW